MSGDSRIFHFTASNNGSQVSKNTHWQVIMGWDVGGPIDITNITLQMKIRDNTSDDSVILTLDETTDELATGINKIDPVNGKFRLQIDKSDTPDIPEEIYSYDIIYTEQSPALTKVFLKGNIEFVQVNTR